MTAITKQTFDKSILYHSLSLARLRFICAYFWKRCVDVYMYVYACTVCMLHKNICSRKHRDAVTGRPLYVIRFEIWCFSHERKKSKVAFIASRKAWHAYDI